jgi:hypothetical protein
MPPLGARPSSIASLPTGSRLSKMKERQDCSSVVEGCPVTDATLMKASIIYRLYFRHVTVVVRPHQARSAHTTECWDALAWLGKVILAASNVCWAIHGRWPRVTRRIDGLKGAHRGALEGVRTRVEVDLPRGSKACQGFKLFSAN